jgi:glycosyltransferase involved in cell wall biosynthesis
MLQAFQLTPARRGRQVKVLYLVTAYPRHPADVITPWLTETIRRLGERGIDVEVLAPSYRGLADQTVEGVRVHRFRYAPAPWETLTHDQTAPDRIRERPRFLGLVPGYVAAGSLAAARLARSGRFDLLHAFWPLPHGLLGLAAKRASGVPLVCTFFGVELTWMESQLPFLGPVLRRIVRGSDAVTTISTYTAERLRRLVPDARSVVIPFGATVEAPPEPPPVSDPVAEGRPFELLFVGRLVERKGVHVLLDALARLDGSAPVLLRVVGDGPERAALQARAERLGLGARVEFEGFVSSEELAARFAGCDAFVLPAVVDAKGDTEGLGVVLLEAMVNAKPVVASAAGGIVDIVRDGGNGWLAPPGDVEALADALRACMADPERRRRYGLQGRADVAAGFSWDVIVDRLAGLYHDVAARSGKRSGTATAA